MKQESFERCVTTMVAIGGRPMWVDDPDSIAYFQARDPTAYPGLMLGSTVSCLSCTPFIFIMSDLHVGSITAILVHNGDGEAVCPSNRSDKLSRVRMVSTTHIFQEFHGKVWSSLIVILKYTSMKIIKDTLGGLGDWAYYFGVIFSKIFKHQVQGFYHQVHWLEKPMLVSGRIMPRNNQFSVFCPEKVKYYPEK